MILYGFVGRHRYPSGAYTYISADQVTISTGTSVGISHDQHISRFCVMNENRNVRTRERDTNVLLLGNESNC
jgi:hypothetical protein